jgi:phosphotransacetylase
LHAEEAFARAQEASVAGNHENAVQEYLLAAKIAGGASAAAELGIIVPILVGPVAKITAVAKQHGINIARYELVDAPHSEAAAAKAVELIRESKGELLMKGSLHTDELMRSGGPYREPVRQQTLHVANKVAA